MSRSKCIALGIALAALAASCGSSDSGSVTIGEPEIELIDSNALYPAEFYSMIDQDLLNEFDGSAIVEVDRIQNETVQLCMGERGFDFPAEPAQAGGLEPPEPGVSELEFAQLYGLGVAHFGAQTVQVGPVTDFISEHVAKLPPNEAASFNRAYYGEAEGAIDDFRADDPQSDSCLGQSLQAGTDARSEIASLEQMDLLSSSVAAINQRFRADSRTTAAYAPYGSCMRDAGYEVDLPAEAIALAQRNFGDFLRQHAKIDGAFDAAGQQALGETIEAEVRIALAALSCEAPLRPLLNSIYMQIEGEWIAQNEPTLVALGSLE